MNIWLAIYVNTLNSFAAVQHQNNVRFVDSVHFIFIIIIWFSQIQNEFCIYLRCYSLCFFYSVIVDPFRRTYFAKFLVQQASNSITLKKKCWQKIHKYPTRNRQAIMMAEVSIGLIQYKVQIWKQRGINSILNLKHCT